MVAAECENSGDVGPEQMEWDDLSIGKEKMHAVKNKLERIEMVLRETFCRQATPVAAEGWTMDVMRSVRRVVAKASGVKPQSVTYIAWRAVWATAAAALIVAAADFALLPSMNEVGWQAHEIGIVLE